MSLEEILDMLKKNFVHLGLDKKETKKLQAGLDGYIKAVSIILPFLILSSLAYWLLNLNRVNRTKADTRATFFG